MAKRLQKELKALGQTPLDFATASPVGDNLLHWNAMLEGPADSPYVNGVFSIDLVFPAEYPFKPPKKLRQVLEEPSPDGPLNATAGELLAKDAAKFKETAAKWTKDYAQ
eukprot:Stramenopile-MAST_4_protein_5001